MKRYWTYMKQRVWQAFLPLLLMGVFGGNTLAAEMPSFSASSSGTTNNLTVTANLNVSDADVGKMGNIYLAFENNDKWYFNVVIGWVPFDGGMLPIYPKSGSCLSGRRSTGEIPEARQQQGCA